MNWFERHLNWTLVLCGFIGSYAAAFLGGMIVGVVGRGDLSEVVGMIAGLATVVGVTVWYVGQKGRGWGHVFWLICPFGFIILLCLENQAIEEAGGVMPHEQEQIATPQSSGTAKRAIDKNQWTPYDQRQQCLAYYQEELKLKAFQQEEADLYNEAVVKYGMSVGTDDKAAKGMLRATSRLVESANEILRRRAEMRSVPDMASAMYFAWQTTYSDYLAWASAQAAAVSAAAEGMVPHGQRVRELLEESEKSRRKAEGEEKKLLKRLKLSSHEMRELLAEASVALEE